MTSALTATCAEKLRPQISRAAPTAATPMCLSNQSPRRRTRFARKPWKDVRLKPSATMAKAECDRIMTINCLANPTQRTGEPEAHARASVPERFRRLKWNQAVWLATSLRMSAFFNCGQGGCSPSWLVCETNLREGRKRKIPTDLNQKNQNKTQNIMAKLLKIAGTKDVPPGQTAGFSASFACINERNPK